MSKKSMTAEGFCAMIAANVDDDDLDDESFRKMVSNTIESVNYQQEDSANENDRV